MVIVIKSILLKTGNIIRQSLVFTAAFSLVLQPIFCNQAFANPSNIIPDGTTQTTTELSPNNITVVNIATPTQSGTSMNNFDQFNVDQTGAIMNNSSVVTNTQIGGWIYANPHLANGTQASVIVGEVTGNMPSNLLGYTEIAGGKAEFVLLNPNGIACQGCGFINTNSLTLGTGSGIYNADGSLASINMGNGNFSVSGAGLDATLVDYFRVISKNIQLSAPIWAKDELAIYQGSSNFNANTNTFSGTANPQTGQTIGIDVSALGAMYAGKATLIASDLGLGVNIASDVITSRDGITITANGDIMYNNLTSATSTNITANNNGSITQNGSLKSSNGDTNLTAANNINIAGTSISSTGNTSLTAGDPTGGSSQNISNSNNLSLQTNNLTTASTGNTTLQNLNATVSGQTNVTANNLSLINSNVSSTGNFTSNVMNTTNLNNTVVSTNGNANLTTKDLTLTTSTLSANQVSITASNNVSTTNSGINSNTSVLLNAQNSITNSNSKIKGITDVTINSASLSNTSGTLINSNGAVSVTSTTISNDGSQIYSVGNQNLITNSLTNQNLSLIYSGGTLGINNTSSTNLTSLTNSSSDIYSASNLNLKANTLTNQNSSTIGTSGLLTLTSNSLTNQASSAISSTGSMSVVVSSILNDNNSKITTDGNLTINASGSITQNNSKILANNNLDITSSGFTNTGSLTNSGGAINITSASISNDGSQIYSVGNQSLITNTLTNQNSSLIYTSGTLKINNTANTNLTTLLNSGSNIYAEGNTNIKSNTFTNTSSSSIQTKGTLDIISQTFKNLISSKILATDTTNITATSLKNTTTSTIATDGALTAIITGDINQSGSELIAKGNMVLSLANLSSLSGSLINTDGTLSITSTTITNDASQIYSGSNQTLITNSLINQNSSLIYSVGTLNVNTSSGQSLSILTNNTSTIQSGSDMSLKGDAFTNASSSIIKSGGILGIISQIFTNQNSSKIASNGNLSVIANSLSNTSTSSIYTDSSLTETISGSITQTSSSTVSKGSMIISSANLSSMGGSLINADGTLDITASTSISNDGSQIYSGSNQSLTTNSLTNQNNSLIYSGGILGINNTGNTNLTALINSGSQIYSSGNLALKANTLTNSSSSLIQTGGTLNINSQTLTNQTASQILATGNTNITATTLNNTGNSLIQTNGTLIEAVTGNITQDNSQTLATGTITINASSFTNQNSSVIRTENTLNITLTSNLNNTGSSSIIATSNATLIAVNASNTTSSNIITGGNFNGSYSGTFTNSANLLAFGSVTTNNLNNQNGYLEAGTSVLITNNNFALNNSGGTIQSDAGNTTINSNYQFNNTNGQLNSASDINLNIKANQNYTDTNSKINAGGSIYLNSSGYDITEGSGVKFKTSNLFQVTASNFTNNSDINVGYIDFALSNALVNNANLISTNDSQYIIRKNITNTGTIAGGATLLLQGANITNTNVGGSTGLIYSAGNMEVAGSTSITNNANSAIVSGGTLGIYADTLITNGSNAQMWSVGNLTLAGYGNTSVATFNNGSTSGAAYLKSQANMQIYANQINNIGKDNASLTEGNAYTVATVGYGGYPGMNSSKIMSQEVATNILTSTNSQIVAGGSMLINGNVYNQTADVLAGGNLTINGNVTNNVTHFTTRSLSESWANTYEDCWSSAFGGLFCSTEHDWWSGSHTNTFSSLTPSRIAAGGNLTISGSQISNDGGSAVYQNNTPLGGSSGGTNSGYSGSYASSFTNSSSLGSSPTSGSGTTGTTPTITLVTTSPTNGANPTIVSVNQQNPNASLASPSLDLTAISNPAIASINTNPPVLTITNANGQNINFTYLVESNPAFAQQHNFLTSTYFFEHLDYSPSRQIILAFDPYSERRTVEDTIARTGIVQYLGNGAIDGLYANGLKYLEGNTTQIGHELTQAQISSLTQDIIIPVEEEVNGQIMLVPKIYFSADTLAKAQDINKAGGQIYAGGNVTLLSNGDLTNKGYIGSGGNTSLIVQNDFNNIGGEINTGSNLSITAKNTILSALTDQNNQVQDVSKFNVGANLLINATENISAYGASIKTGLDTYLTAGNNITIAAATSSSSMSEQGGDMSESKSKAVASVLESGGNINIKSGGDFSLLAGQDTYSSHFAHTDDGALGTSSSVTKDQSSLTNVASTIKGNNVSIDSGNDATIVASNITATNNLSLEAKGNTNILASKDMSSSFSQETSSAGFISNSIDVKNHYNESVASSNLTAGNSMLISSGKDVNILGSNITGKDGNIVAGYYQDDPGNITRNEGSVNVMSVTEMAKNYEYSKSTTFDPIGFVVATTTGILAGTATGNGIAGGIAGAEVGLQSQRGSIDIDSNTRTKQVSSNLNFDNLNVISSKDINVVASNITTTNDTTLLAGKTFDDIGVLTNSNTDGLINILSATENQQSQKSHTDITPNYVALAMGGATAGAVAGFSYSAGGMLIGLAGGHIAADGITNNMERAYQNQSGVNDEAQGGTQKSSVLNAGGDLTLVATGDTNISASSLFGKNSVQIASENGNVNITSAEETSKTSHETWNDVGTSFSAKADVLKANASMSVTVDTESHKQVDTSTTQKSSDIKSDGAISLSGKDITLTSSNLTASNIIIDAKDNFTTATKADTHTTETYDTRSALIVTAGVGNTYVDIAYQGVELAKLIKDLTSNPDEGKLEEGQTNSAEYERNQQINRIITGAKALLLSAALAKVVEQTVKAGTTAPAFGFYGYGSLTVESSSAKSTNTTTNEVQNQILAGNLIDLTAGTDANIYGSQLVAGNSINITAQNLTLESSKNNQTSGSSSVYDSVTGMANTGGTFGASFTHAESGSSLTSTTNVASSITSDNVSINTSGDTNVLGSVIAGSNSVLLNAQNLNVTTLQDVLSSSAESHSYTFGTDIGFSISSSSHDKLWAGTQAGITSGDVLDINVGGNTSLVGSLINSETGNLNLVTNTLTHSDLQQSEKDWNYAYSLGMNFSPTYKDTPALTPATNMDGSTNVYGQGGNKDKGRTTISASNSGFEKEGVAQATVGEGNITTTSNVDGLNRDETQSMLVTKNERTGGLDSTITIDNNLILHPITYIKDTIQAFKNLPDNLMQVSSATIAAAVKVIDKLSPDQKVIYFAKQAAETQVLAAESEMLGKSDPEKEAIKQTAKDLGVDVDAMSDKQKIAKLSELYDKSKDEGLSDSDKAIRNALFVSVQPSDAYKSYRSDLVAKTVEKLQADKSITDSVKNWDTLSTVDKTALLQKMSDIQMSSAGRGSVLVKTYYNEPENGMISNGYYNGTSININQYNYNNINSVFATLFHEGGHAIQDNMTDKVGIFYTPLSYILPTSYPPGIKNDLEYMKYNQQMYVTPEENFKVYENLLIEMDARDIGNKYEINLKQINK